MRIRITQARRAHLAHDSRGWMAWCFCPIGALHERRADGEGA